LGATFLILDIDPIHQNDAIYKKESCRIKRERNKNSLENKLPKDDYVSHSSIKNYDSPDDV
jgi:hypothetical protein